MIVWTRGTFDYIQIFRSSIENGAYSVLHIITVLAVEAILLSRVNIIIIIIIMIITYSRNMNSLLANWSENSICSRRADADPRLLDPVWTYCLHTHTHTHTHTGPGWRVVRVLIYTNFLLAGPATSTL